MGKRRETQEAVERILGDEALTADLTDAAARLLLERATAEAERIVRETEGSPEERQARLRALRRDLRRIARQAGRSSPTDQVERVQALLGLTVLAAQAEGAAEGKPDRPLWLRPAVLLFFFVVLALGLQQCIGGSLFGRRAATETVAGDWVTVYFTRPQVPDDPLAHAGGIDADLVALIEAAERKVDLAAYDLDLETVADALAQARGRDISVRLVTDGSNVDEEAVTRLRQVGVPIVARPDEDWGIMHDKFAVVDGTWVWTGSWNLTENGTYRNDNNAVLIASQLLAQDYAAEFEEMFSGLFGSSSPANTPYPVIEVEAGSEVARIEVYFAPEDGATDGILRALSQAQSRVRFLAYHFTSEPLADALIDLARRGVRVEGVIEARTITDTYSQFERLRDAGVEVLADGNPYIMHHKVFIVDDRTVVLGSFNFTRSAEEKNDENVLIVQDPGVAAAYVAEFQRVLEQAQTAEP